MQEDVRREPNVSKRIADILSPHYLPKKTDRIREALEAGTPLMPQQKEQAIEQTNSLLIHLTKSKRTELKSLLKTPEGAVRLAGAVARDLVDPVHMIGLMHTRINDTLVRITMALRSVNKRFPGILKVSSVELTPVLRALEKLNADQAKKLSSNMETMKHLHFVCEKLNVPLSILTDKVSGEAARKAG